MRPSLTSSSNSMTSEAKALVKPTYSLTTELSNRATNTSLSTVTDSLPIPTVMIMLLRSPLGRRHRIRVNHQVVPNRGHTPEVTDAIPLGVIRALTQEARIPEVEVHAMTKAEAIARLGEFYTTGR